MVGNAARLYATDDGSGSVSWEQGDEAAEPKAEKYKSPWKLRKEKMEDDGSVSENIVPQHTDILVVGGGVIGSSVAYWIKQQSPKSTVTVVERDPVYTRAASMLSCGGIRHQFSVPENVQLSLYTSAFLTNIKQHLSVLDESLPDVQFNNHGYLFLAQPQGAEQLAKNVAMQRDLGAQIALLNKKQLEEKYPWMCFDGIDCGALGLEGEGWFDPWSLVRALKQKNISMGSRYVHGELVSFEFHSLGNSDDEGSKIDSGVIRTAGGGESEVRFSLVINCAGPWAAEVAEMAKIGTGDGVLSLPLPVEPRKRFVFVTHCSNGPKLDCPFVVDPSGMYFRREGLGGHYICGCSPASEADEPEVDNLEVDYNVYDERVWPLMANRAPCFNNSKLKSAWAGFYDYNVFDQNLVIGPHPYLKNFYFANGLSGHGLQHSVAIGRAVMELIIYGSYQTINLQKFHFDRFFTKTAVLEEGII
ncbi:unnamed protein product [Candidula unifasciata]|uniref:FAD-dependent oxidoreductase domain-containing protein 1 n=1 Tax=Candidula unifasciata TaxID=100452 RepID=A0A8S3YMJ3_9EUPU|nr:unnamed protein product [Candidula unifasciata]